MIHPLQSGNDAGVLLRGFNERQESALHGVYEIFYSELVFFAGKMCRGSEIPSKDLVHDAFISVWEKKNLYFTSLDKIKGYLYVAIRNRFRDHYSHRRHVLEHKNRVEAEGDLITRIAEPEVYSILAHALDILPEECAKVFRMHLEGWNIKEIAEKLGKSESTVYKQRQQAVETLRKKLPPSSFKLLMIFFGV